MDGVNQGVISRADKIQKFSSEATKEFGISSTTQPLIVEHINADNVVVIEFKKRRTEDGLDPNNENILYLNRDIQMLVDHEKHSNGSRTEIVSKNVYAADTRGSARHSS